MKIKLFTHSDGDGIGCEVVLRAAFHLANIELDLDVTECEPSANAANNIDKMLDEFFLSNRISGSINSYEYIFITDISPSSSPRTIQSLSMMNLWRTDSRGNTPICILDHHRTSPFFIHKDLFEASGCTGEVKVTGDGGRLECGTSILFDYLLRNVIPLQDNYSIYDNLKYYVELVRLYDTWEWKNIDKNDTCLLSDVTNLNLLAKELPREQFVSEIVNHISDSNLITHGLIVPPQLRPLVKFISKKSEMYIDKKVKSIYIKDNIGYIFADNYASEIGNTACITHPDIDFCVIIMGSVVSLRTTSDTIDVSEIAKRYGGGGHQKAAGFSINVERSLETFINLFRI